MNKEFSQENSHEGNTKISIDKILNKETKVKRVRKNAESIKKALFVGVIDKIVMLEERAIIVEEAFQIDLKKYNDPYQTIIEDLFSLMFSKSQINLIDFYLYDRHAADGTVVPLRSEDGEELKLENASDLWNLINIVQK